MNLLAEKLFISDLWRLLRILPTILRWKIYGLFLLIFLVAIFEVLSILSMTFTGMCVAAPQILLADPTVQTVLGWFPGLAEDCKDQRYFTLYASIAVVILTLIKNILTAILAWKQSGICEEVGAFAAEAIMSDYLHRPYLWHISSESSETMTALYSRASLINLLVQILNIYTYAGTAIALVCILISATPSMILLVLGLTGFLCWAVYSSMRRALDNAGKVSLQSSTLQNNAVNNAVNGIREVLIYRQQPVFLSAFLNAGKLGQRSRAFLIMAPPLPTWILEVYGYAAIPFTTWILIYYYNADMALIAGVVTMVMLAAWRILPILNRSLSSLVVARSVRPAAMVCLKSLETIRHEELASQAEPDPDFHFDRDISLENVFFRYPLADTDALKDVSCMIRKGQQVGVVGLSGSGKSTLVGVLSGLLEPESGHFLVDGHELTAAGLAAYRSKIGYVPQTPYLMGGSIAENVAFSQWGKPYDEDQVRRACEMAALDVIENDERGIEYPLGERGSGLSGGQAQRVAIARALYAKPEILILDESTSALDQQTEAAIMATINDLKDELTMIIIAHRLTTVEHCDWIIWLENGHIHAQGPGPEILAKYRESLVADK